MISIKMMPHGVEISGHAGAGEPGEDVVCAAVSALAWTLYAALDDAGILSTGAMEPGHAIITATDRKHPYLDMAEIGFRKMAERNREYVKYFSVRLGRDAE